MKLPVISGKEAIKAFEKIGWHIDRRARSRHIIMKKSEMKTTLSIPEHKTLDVSELNKFRYGLGSLRETIWFPSIGVTGESEGHAAKRGFAPMEGIPEGDSLIEDFCAL
jgi:predicted RNA binding protein YcfA (HicA-like mRNA interferase family)